MVRFLEPFKYEQISKKWYWLQEDLHFYFTLEDVMSGHTPYLRQLLAETGLKADQTLHVTAPKGFVTDLASIPPSLQWLFKPDGPWAKAAVIHDIIYQSLKERTTLPENPQPIDMLNAKHTKLLADRIFLCGMRTLGVNAITRTAMYNAVRAFGGSSYGGEAGSSDYGLQPILVGSLRAENYPIFRTVETIGVPENVQRLHAPQWRYHTVHYPNLKRGFVYHTQVV